MELPSAHLRTLCYTVFLLVDLKVADATPEVRHWSWLRGRRMAAQDARPARGKIYRIGILE